PRCATAGAHRFTWPAPSRPRPAGGGGRGGGGLPIAAVPFDTVPAPTTPRAAPGEYTVKLTANGTTHSQPIRVKPDPRVKTPALAMQQVYTLSRAMYFEARAITEAAAAAQASGKDAAELNAGAAALLGVMNSLQAADVPATARQVKAIADARAAAAAAMAKWKAAR